MILSAIAAMSENRVIGANNTLPWHVPEDLQFFRQKTKGHILIMGRKTFESLGGKPLPGRMHLVISRDSLAAPSSELVHWYSSLPAAMATARELAGTSWPEEVFVAGGGEIYRLAMQYCNRVYLTVIRGQFIGDAHFPELDSGLVLSESRETPSCVFQTWDRRTI